MHRIRVYNNNSPDKKENPTGICYTWLFCYTPYMTTGPEIPSERQLENLRLAVLRAVNNPFTRENFLSFSEIHTRYLYGIIWENAPYSPYLLNLITQNLLSDRRIVWASDPGLYRVVQTLITPQTPPEGFAENLIKDYDHETAHFLVAQKSGFPAPYLGYALVGSETEGYYRWQPLFTQGVIPKGMTREKFITGSKAIALAPPDPSPADLLIGTGK